jgi:hypothetical protein
MRNSNRKGDEIMTRTETVALLGLLKTAFPRFYSDVGDESNALQETVEMWHLMLSDTTFDIAQVALYKLIATCKFPPSIAEMRECIAAVNHPEIPDPGEAWMEVITAIRYHGYMRQDEALASMNKYARQAVSRIGWRALCHGENEMADRAHFFRVYEAIVRRIEQNRLLPTGLQEAITAMLEDANPEMLKLCSNQ